MLIINQKQRRRLIIILSAAFVLAFAFILIIYAINDALVYFQTPTQVLSSARPLGARIRLGGLVTNDSIIRSPNSTVYFKITDGSNVIKVCYKGILPDLFKENKGVVVEGKLEKNLDGLLFIADTVFAKHDENYVPKDIENIRVIAN